MTVTSDDIQALLARTMDPFTNRPYGDLVKDIEVDRSGHVILTFRPGYPVGRGHDPMLAPLTAALEALGLSNAQIHVQPKIEAHAIRAGVERVKGVKNIIAVASGKGGVGKSTTAVNLALALADEGAAVGLLDADIYGPSVPLLLGLDGRPDSKDNKTMEPLVGHGIKCNSIGFLVDADTPAIWRGPMVTQALEQLLRQTNWGELDYLIIDMPPGTGDIALTLAQKVPVSGAVIVSTPQDIALLDARKGVRMFEKVTVPVLGIIENMSVHVCPSCGHVEHLFGEGGAQRMADEFQVPFLGKLPLALSIRENADAGNPTVVAAPDGVEAGLYREIAHKLAARLAGLPKDMASKFPTVVVEQRRH
ncbi:MAG: iron-sulfur cluster carrier protein ApbC [Burkholderiaceae bacterium]|nr:iron-sulfur cluster carrier protein ApbC [Burkholderiaceae bacterium]MCD8517358.1 iron-sulfur cluster carrier protein ApbC [Burkholderiaceae bacterium]MCD8538124.1 iron-sulfur cluster carrier protein ApbC [Burkholderiaceae bacterium]MCD8566270.1 iron-sulfur cluster carrier protein ApbC [Burkholderiaceae bacterium]